MWIRSQSKDVVTKVSHLKILHLYNTGYCIFTDNTLDPNTTTNLGTYSTKEKAIKVLDKIVDRIRDIHCGNCRRDIVLQMPQDDEVEND